MSKYYQRSRLPLDTIVELIKVKKIYFRDKTVETIVSNSNITKEQAEIMWLSLYGNVDFIVVYE